MTNAMAAFGVAVTGTSLASAAIIPRRIVRATRAISAAEITGGGDGGGDGGGGGD